MMRGRAFNGLVLGAALVSACATPGPVALGDLRPGESVRTTQRVASGDAVHASHLVRQVNGSIEVTLDDQTSPVRIRLLDLERLQVVRGRATRRGGLVGAVAGGMGGIVIGMVCRGVCSVDKGAGHQLLPVVGFAIGMPVGAAIGAVLAPARWVDVRLR